MGTEKALVPFKGRPMVHWSISILSQVADELIVSVSPTPSEGLLRTLGSSVKIVKDERPGMGPLHGLISSFRVVRGEYVAVAPCDSPCIEVGLYDLLFSKAVGRGGAVPLVRGFYEPLIAVYHREEFLEAMERSVDEGKSKPIDAYPFIDLAYVTEAEIIGNGLSLDSFVNINLSHDLENATKRTHS